MDAPTAHTLFVSAAHQIDTLPVRCAIRSPLRRDRAVVQQGRSTGNRDETRGLVY